MNLTTLKNVLVSVKNFVCTPGGLALIIQMAALVLIVWGIHDVGNKAMFGGVALAVSIYVFGFTINPPPSPAMRHVFFGASMGLAVVKFVWL